MRIRRPTPAPRAFRRHELARVGVDVTGWRRGMLRCRACGLQWRARPERYVAFWWCPMGCNRPASSASDRSE